MRVGVRVVLVVGVLALGLPRLARAAPVPLLDQALASPVAGATAASMPVVVGESGSGAGAGLSPWLPCAASIVPGFGQLINGEGLKAAGFFASAVVFYVVGALLLVRAAKAEKGQGGAFGFDGLVVFLSGAGVTGWSMWDAYHVAKVQQARSLAPVPVIGAPAAVVGSGETAVEHSLGSGIRLPLVALRF